MTGVCIAQGPNVLVRCVLCGDYSLAPADVVLCLDCARRVHLARIEVERDGGRLIVVDGDVAVYSAEMLATPEGQWAYSIDVQRAIHERRKAAPHTGEA